MNDMLVGILGLSAIAATVISLTRGKMLPAMAFILWPSVLALAMVAAGRGGCTDQEPHQGQRPVCLGILIPVPCVRHFHRTCSVLKPEFLCS